MPPKSVFFCFVLFCTILLTFCQLNVSASDCDPLPQLVATNTKRPFFPVKSQHYLRIKPVLRTMLRCLGMFLNPVVLIVIVMYCNTVKCHY